MEQRNRFQHKLNSLSKAVAGFEESLNINLSGYSKEVSDAIKNGRIQKFEYSSELIWKTIKDYLNVNHGIDAKSPKQSIKEFYLLGVVSEPEYNALLSMMDDRNRLSHIYNEEYFDEIHNKLQNYLIIMKKVGTILSAD
ncbi:MAG: HI0074 family nucleotidyltransferase substrate-binding subunit [Ignavibacteriaceae bacterium]|nr:HI0074 family nucleotidyltransferase substrate-binding subunit [Ignavibacteriaceae bacterium]